MRGGPVRLGKLVRLILKASWRTLAQNLRSLEGAGIVIRRGLSDLLLHVEYDLQPVLRNSIYLLMEELSTWDDLYSQNSFARNRPWDVLTLADCIV